MTASFIGLACLAALNPKLLVVDLLLIGNRRPVPMFVCFMLGGIGLAVTIGLGCLRPAIRCHQSPRLA